MGRKSIGGHQSAAMVTDTWLTPPHIIQALGKFDLDPCTPPEMPWQTADHRYTEEDDGLSQPWFGRVWLNPPYGVMVGKWLDKMAHHGNGIALTFARTETDNFFRGIWERATGILFLRGRLTFHYPDGSRAKANGGAPSVLVAYGTQNAECLEAQPIAGQYLPISYRHVIVVGSSPTWISVIKIAFNQHGDGDLTPIYEMVERMAPDKIKNNIHWKAKVRQCVQVCRKKIAS